MFRRFGIVSRGTSCLILVLAGLFVPAPASAQGFESAVLSRARVFPDFHAGLFTPTISTPPPGSAPTRGAATSQAGFAGRPVDHFSGPRGRFGEGLYNMTGTVKVNLDHSVPSSPEKPVITALGVDPASQDIWAAVGKVLVHFDQNGSYLGEYFIATPEGAPLRVSAIIIEPDRLIVASDSRGVYEFPRFDRNTSRSSVQGAVIPQQGLPQKPTQQ